ncbi:hypothetical protein ACFYOG_06830 [Streptomyces sp. NPDC007818]|uniref:hypothetical protein n=1 Tax=Streptomyces sp. NPDC007818 TaxID=3364780 RepID=UPI0036799E0C
MTAVEAHDPREAALVRLRARLPAHLLARDAEADRLLDALLGAVAGELAVLEADLDELYDAWFVETCADWVVPYLADLVGLDEVPTGLGLAGGPRAMVANTVAYRRRKGTLGVLEQIARDVTGRPARAVEFYRLLVTTAHVDHVRGDRPATASVRDAARAELCGLDLAGPFSLTPGLDPLAHTAEVRRIGSGRGRYGIPAVGIFLHPVQVYEVGAPGSPDAVPGTGTHGGWSRARRLPGGEDGYAFDPLGRRSPLFAPPPRDEATGGIEHLAGEADLPVPLRPRRLLALLASARRSGDATEPLPLGVRIGSTGTVLPPEAVKVRGLEAVDATPRDQVLVDPVSGTLTCYRDCAVRHPADGVFVRYAYGSVADVGAGTHDRTEVHEAALALDACPSAGGAGAPYAGHTAVRSGAPAAGPEKGTLGEAFAAAEAAWAAGGGTYEVTVADSATYEESPGVDVPAGARLVLVAAGRARRPSDEATAPRPGAYTPSGVRPHLVGDLTVTGAEGSSVLIDGLVLEGDLVVAAGRLAGLTLSQCTVTGRIRVEETAERGNGRLRVRVVSSVVNGVSLGTRVPSLCVTGSAVAGDVTGAAAHAAFEDCTVRGAVTVRSLDGSSCVLDGTVTVEHRQTGCLRFSYSGPGSRTPRRYRCVPEEADGTGPGPVYASLDPGSPVYLALGRGCSDALRTGGESGAEMGVHHPLRRPLRVAAAARALAPYLPVQAEIGMCGS